MKEMKISIQGRVYTLNNNSDKYDRATHDAGESASNEKILAHYDKLAGLIKDENGDKIENGRFWKKEKERLVGEIVSDLDEREKFRTDFLTLLKVEKSNYAKLILQENLISFEVISLLMLIQSVINLDCISARYIDKTRIWIRLDNEKLQNRTTFGQLVSLLGNYLNDSLLLTDLNTFNTLRNNITHKALHYYKKFSDLHKDSEKVVLLGGKIINNLEIMSKEIVKVSQENRVTEIKPTDLIKDSRAVINDNFYKIESRLDKIERELKRNKD